MKRNIILLVVVLTLGAVAFYLVKNKPGTFSFSKKDTFDPRSQEFSVADTGSVTKIFIADPAKNNVLLERKGPGHWMVNNKFRVRKDAMDLLLKTIKDVSVQKMVEPAMKDNILKGMIRGGIKVEIYKGDEKIRQYYIGGTTPDQLGTYMLLSDLEEGGNFPEPYVMEIKGFQGYLSTRFMTKEGDWRDRAIFEMIPPEMKSVEVKYLTSPENSFRIDLLSTNSFTVTRLKENKILEHPDTAAIKQYLSYFQSIHFEGLEKVLTKEQKDSVLSSIPAQVITVTKNNGQKTEVKLFFKAAAPGLMDEKGPVLYDKDRMYALVNGKDFVLVQYFVFGKLLQPVTYFLPGKEVVKK